MQRQASSGEADGPDRHAFLRVAQSWRRASALLLAGGLAALLLALALRIAGMAPAWHASAAFAALLLLAAAGLAAHAVRRRLAFAEALLRAVLQRVGTPLYAEDATGRRLLGNATAAALPAHAGAAAPAAVACVELPNRGWRTFELSRVPLRDADGRPLGILGCGRDVTDALEAQAARTRHDALQLALFTHNPLPVLVYDETNLRILDVNAAAIRLYGWTREEFLQLDLYGIRPPDEAERLRAYMSQPRPEQVACVQGWRHRRKDGAQIEVEVGSTRVERDGRAVRFAIVRDVGDERRLQRAQADLERRHRDLVESGLGMIWSHDLDGRVLTANTAMAQALGHAPEDLVGRNLVEFVPEEGRQDFYEYLMRIRNLRRDAGVVQVQAHGGERRVWQYRNVFYPDGNPQPYVLGSAQDITLRHHYELRLREQNQKDALTGAYNRRYLEQFAARAEAGQRWGCIVVDLDHFKHYNDTYGHQKGDEILLGVTRFLQHNSRNGDAVVRLGGDEFLIVLPEASTAVVREVAGRLREGVARNEVSVDFSMGWAVRQDDEPIEATIRRADQSLIQVRAVTRGAEARMPRH